MFWFNTQVFTWFLFMSIHCRCFQVARVRQTDVRLHLQSIHEPRIICSDIWVDIIKWYILGIPFLAGSKPLTFHTCLQTDSVRNGALCCWAYANDSWIPPSSPQFPKRVTNMLSERRSPPPSSLVCNADRSKAFRAHSSGRHELTDICSWTTCAQECQLEDVAPAKLPSKRPLPAPAVHSIQDEFVRLENFYIVNGRSSLHQIVYLVLSSLIPNALLTGYILN
jgi:hypothetical protein